MTGSLGVVGLSVGIGRRLLKFIDNFSIQNSVSYNRYFLKNYNVSSYGLNFPNGTGTANNISFINSISRYNINEYQNQNPSFPLSGSNTSLTLTLTPPYSVFSEPDPANQYKFVEFHKWMVDNDWYVTLIPHPQRSLVMRMGSHFGFIGSYKSSTKIGPFERFKVGGSGLSGFNFLLASDVIGLRGYQDQSILAYEPDGQSNPAGGIVYDKLTFELRYPIHLSSAISVFTLGFFEAGNNWGNFKDFNPFNVYRSAGGGLRLNMPAFGLIGLDYGWPLDLLPGATQRKGQFTFTLGQQIR